MTMRATKVGFAIGLATIIGWAGLSRTEAKVFDPKSFTLPNGLQVVVIENHRAPVVTQMIWYKVGSADEPAGKSGIAHYLEHLMFKATKNLKTGEFSKIVARNGGRDNAFTSNDYTAYHQTVAADRLDIIMGLEADRMKNLIIDREGIEPERQVVLEERRSRTENRPAGRLREQLNAALYLNYPYRVPIIGWPNDIRTISKEDLERFYRHWYTPNNAILIIGGDTTLEKVRPMAEKHFGPIPRGPEVKRDRTVEPEHQAARQVVLRDARVRQPSWRRAYLAPSFGWGAGEHAYPLEVLATVIGGGTTSRLYRKLVVERKIALSASAFYDGEGIGPTSFFVSATPAPGTTLEMLEQEMEKEISALLRDGISADELARTKRSMKSQAVYARDSLRAGPQVIGAALSTGRTIADAEAWPEKIAAVTAEQILAAARAVFIKKQSVTGLLRGQETN